MPENETKGIFDEAQREYEETDADARWWPDKGTHEVYLVGVSSRKGEFRQKDLEPIEAALVTFKYELCADPHSDGPPRRFSGSPCIIPAKMAQVAEDHRFRVERDMKRLKTNLNIILDRDEANLGKAIDDAAALGEAFDSGEEGAVPVTLLLNIHVRKDTYHTDYVKKRLSGPTA